MDYAGSDREEGRVPYITHANFVKQFCTSGRKMTTTAATLEIVKDSRLRPRHMSAWKMHARTAKSTTLISVLEMHANVKTPCPLILRTLGDVQI